MFIVADEVEFTWPVTFRQPVSGGTWSEVQVEFRFRQIRNSAFGALQRELQQISASAPTEEEALDRAATAYERIVRDWTGDSIGDPDGTPLPYSKAALIALLDMPGAGRAIIEAYAAAITGTGREERRRGN